MTTIYEKEKECKNEWKYLVSSDKIKLHKLLFSIKYRELVQQISIHHIL